MQEVGRGELLPISVHIKKQRVAVAHEKIAINTITVQRVHIIITKQGHKMAIDNIINKMLSSEYIENISSKATYKSIRRHLEKEEKYRNLTHNERIYTCNEKALEIIKAYEEIIYNEV